MKSMVAFLALLINACSGPNGRSAVNQPLPNQSDFGRVYYYDFNIARITGLHEGEIEQYGTKLCIVRGDFLESLFADANKLENQKYNKLDVRAKVVFPEGHYFIDSAGTVFGDQKTFVLDRKMFVAKLKPFKNC